jgi:putative aldouronate transport system permease protein
MRMKLDFKDRAFNWFANVFIFVFSLFCLIPFLLMISGSITAESELVTTGYSLYPKNITLDAYQLLFRSPVLLQNYFNSLFVTIVGTLLGLIVSSMLAYSIANKRNQLRGVIAFVVYFTMLFSGGIVPFYMVVSRYLQLSDTLWALIFPLVVQPFLVFLMVSFFRTIPLDLEEAGRIDGAGEATIFFRIMVPVSKPILATVGLFYALTYWNDWFMALLFINNDAHFPLQLMLRRLISNIEAAKHLIPSGASITINAPSMQIRMAMTLLTIGPIIFLYPFVQRHFVKGLTVGAIKG